MPGKDLVSLKDRLAAGCGDAALGLAGALALALLASPSRADTDFTDLALHEGERVSAIDLAGNKVTKAHVIAREIQTRVGEPLRLETIRGDVGRLDNLQIFSEVRVVAQDDGEKQVHLRFVFRELPPWIAAPAVTYTEENGFSAGLALSALNLAGRGIRLSATALFGGTTQYWVRMGWPWIAGDDHLSLDLDAAHRVRNDTLNGFEERSDEFTPRVGRYLGKSGRVAGMFSLFRMKSDVSGKTLSPDNQDLLVRLGATVGWDTRDSWTNPRKGWRNEIELWKTGGVLGGDGDFYSFTVDVRRWQPTAARQKVLLSGLLTLQSGTLGADVPIYMDYHLGGANTIRGYNVNELGKTLYGKNQLIGTTEYAFTLLPPRRFTVWKLSLRLGVELALFADAGIAWSENRDFALERARAGGGAGIRLLLPGVEMVRLDVGWSPEGGFQFHFAGGSKPTRQRDRLR